MKKAIIYASHGLGDGLIFLSLAYNLNKKGYKVDLFHPFLEKMQSWISYCSILLLPGS